MIKVNILKIDNNIKHIQMKGHANYDTYGKDIVCAAASSIVITTINSIIMFNENYIDYKEEKDLLKIDVLEHNEITTKLITNMLNMLKELMDSYPDNIKIKEENS